MVPDVYISFPLKNKRCAIFLEETDVQIQQQIGMSVMIIVPSLSIGEDISIFQSQKTS